MGDLKSYNLLLAKAFSIAPYFNIQNYRKKTVIMKLISVITSQNKQTLSTYTALVCEWLPLHPSYINQLVLQFKILFIKEAKGAKSEQMTPPSIKKGLLQSIGDQLVLCRSQL